MHQVGDLRRRGAFTGQGLSPRTRLLPSVPPAPRLGSWVRSSGESLTGVPDCLSVGPWVLDQDSSLSLGFPEGSSASWSGWQRSGDSNCNVLSFPGRLVPLTGEETACRRVAVLQGHRLGPHHSPLCCGEAEALNQGQGFSGLPGCGQSGRPRAWLLLS